MHASSAAGAAACKGPTSGGSSSNGSKHRLPPSFSNGGGTSQHVRHQQHQQQQQQQAPGPGVPLQLTFHGVTRYAHNPNEVDWLCQQLLDAGPPGVVGFDMEWRPHFK
jgi:hypothetical protein